MYAEDTIAAIVTAPGPSGVGIVRLSGPGGAAIVERLVTCRHPVAHWVSHRMYRGQLRGAGDAAVDEVLAVIMRAPRSYTGEDVIEVHCHGSPVVLRELLTRVVVHGARLAEPGEFTRRAFLNGRLDLAQAEAVVDLVRARTSAAAALAARQLAGQLSAAVEPLRDSLLRLKALIELQIDFSEEDVSVQPRETLHLLEQCSGYISDIVSTYSYGMIMRDGVRVAIVGKPNVGKSSLLNALLGRDRAIVTAVPGTTRDAIEETADFDGVPVVLTDTAGLRAPGAADAVERLGMERTAAAMAAADLLLIVVDGSEPLQEEDFGVLDWEVPGARVIAVNKADLGLRHSAADAERLQRVAQVVKVSARERSGLQELRRAVLDVVMGREAGVHEGPVLTNTRHHTELCRGLESLALARGSICEGRSADLVAVDVQDAIDHIGAITGVVTSEDVLDRIFSEFCIGK